MARPLRVQYEGALYHVIVRGDDRKAIFQDDDDRTRFLAILRESLETYQAELHAYVLMSNHFHLLLETPRANLSELMRQFNITYTSHYNRRHGRTGHLYQGRYKSILVDAEAYLTMVSRYIHLNPVRIHVERERPLVDRKRILTGYVWSSLRGYIGKEKDPMVTYAKVLGAYGGDTVRGRRLYWQALCADMAQGIELKDRIVAQSILGDDDFVNGVRRRLGVVAAREIPEIKRIKGYHAQDRILAAIKQELGWGIEELRKRGVARQIAMELLYRHGGMKGAEIGLLLGVDYSTVSQGRKRLRERLARDETLRGQMQRVERVLSI